MPNRDRPILCATDFSSSGQRAVDFAVAASRAFRAPLVLVHVMDTGGAVHDRVPHAVAEADRVLHERIEARVAEARAALEREARRARSEPIQVAVLDGRPWQAIVAHAATVDASMIVVGSHGASGPARIAHGAVVGWLLGSTAERVLRHATVPVLVVPSPA